MRVLTIWAENWAKHIDKTDPKEQKLLLCVMTIAQRLQRQFPDKTPLTLFGEIRELRKIYNVETSIDDDKQLGL